MIATHQKRPKTRFKVFTQPSLAIPDQTMSLKVMVTKYVKGLPISAPNNNGKYTDDDLAIDFEKLDLAEQESHLLKVAGELTEVKDKIAKEQRDKAAEAKKTAENVQKELEELRAKLALTT